MIDLLRPRPFGLFLERAPRSLDLLIGPSSECLTNSRPVSTSGGKSEGMPSAPCFR